MNYILTKEELDELRSPEIVEVVGKDYENLMKVLSNAKIGCHRGGGFHDPYNSNKYTLEIYEEDLPKELLAIFKAKLKC